jgi:hypothetical protein
LHPYTDTPEEYMKYNCDKFRFINAKKGFIDRTGFETIFENMIVVEIERRRNDIPSLKSLRALVICDGHSSRCSVKIMSLARKHNIDIFILPSHLTHLLQPLDCGVNRDFKFQLGSCGVDDFYDQSQPQSKSFFIKSLCTVIDKTVIMGSIISAWKNSGLYPFNPSIILRNLPFFARKRTSQTPRGILMVCYLL